jgi:hypothetical protein
VADDQIPLPPALPREEAPTPIPRKSSLEELRASEDPYITAIDELRVEVLRLSARVPEIDERSSKTDLEQEAKLADHEVRMRKIEENTSKAVATTSAAKDDTEALVRALTGAIPPKVVGALLGLGTLVSIMLQVYRAIRGEQ